MVAQCAQQILSIVVVLIVISLTDGVQITYYSLFEVLFQVYFGRLHALILQYVVTLTE